jgi:hypothetical protein
MPYLSFKVLDKAGPLVEMIFVQNVRNREDVNRVVREAEQFVEENFAGQKVYFLNCYDNLQIPLHLVEDLKKEFLRFNAQYAHANVRYGGSVSSKAFWISTAVKEGLPSNFYASREEALDALRGLIREGRCREGV